MMEILNGLTRFLYESFNVAFVLLFLLLALAFYIVRRASVQGSYWASIFHDEAGKVSALRVATLVALAVHSAVLLYMVTSVISHSQASVKDALAGLEWHVVLYAFIWSGAAVVSKAIDAYVAKLGKGA
jgi:hypothetical protein